MGYNKHTRTFSHGRGKRYTEQSLQIPDTTGPASEIEFGVDQTDVTSSEYGHGISVLPKAGYWHS